MRRMVTSILIAGTITIVLAALAIRTVEFRKSEQRQKSELRHQESIAWIANQPGVTTVEKDFLSRIINTDERSALLKSIGDWRACGAYYFSRDGTRAAARDYTNKVAKIFYYSYSGNTPGREVPGFRECYISADKQRSFQELDQRGAATFDGMLDLELTKSCRNSAIAYAKSYNEELARSSPSLFRACGGTPSQIRKVASAVDQLKIK